MFDKSSPHSLGLIDISIFCVPNFNTKHTKRCCSVTDGHNVGKREKNESMAKANVASPHMTLAEKMPACDREFLREGEIVFANMYTES